MHVMQVKFDCTHSRTGIEIFASGLGLHNK